MLKGLYQHRTFRPDPVFPWRASVFDVDGVLADFVTGAKDLMKRKHGIEIPGVATTWAWADPYISSELFWQTIREEENFWYNLPPFPMGITEKIAFHLLEGKRKICFCTVRCETNGWSAYEQTCRWLQDKLKVTAPLVLVIKSHAVVPQLFYTIGVINDNLDQVAAMKELAPYGLCLLDQPWNRDEEARDRLFHGRAPNDFRIVSSVKEFCLLMAGEEGDKICKRTYWKRHALYPWQIVEAAQNLDTILEWDPRRTRRRKRERRDGY